MIMLMLSRKIKTFEMQHVSISFHTTVTSYVKKITSRMFEK